MPRVSSSYGDSQIAKERGPDVSCGKCGKKDEWLCLTRQIPVYVKQTLFDSVHEVMECKEYWDPAKCCMQKMFVKSTSQPEAALQCIGTEEEKYWVKTRNCKCAVVTSSSSSSDEKVVFVQPERKGCKPCGDRGFRGERRGGEGISYGKNRPSYGGERSYVKSHKKK